MSVEEPFPIFALAHKYLIYDPNVIAHVRKAHNICGVLIGSLPQAPQQNVFLGAPLELMPEEARLLVEKEAAYVVDDTKAHKASFLEGGLPADEQKAYHEALRKRGLAAAEETGKRAEERKQAALKKAGDWNDVPDDMLRPSMGPRKKSGTNTPVSVDEAKRQENGGDDRSLEISQKDDQDNLFDQPVEIVHAPSKRLCEPFGITPTTSQPPMTYMPRPSNMPPTPSSYPLFKHMHSKGYFMSPGLRFGCQYTAYPGDPLRFHSHFLCSGMDWDREFDLLDLVGGGRLGTGVKKGYLIGGESPEGEVRTFCIEWAGM